MKAYNELWVNNRAANAKIKAWELEGVLKENEIVPLEDQFYSPNVYVWIGLFFFTSIAISFCSGLFLSLIGFSENSSVLGVVLVIFAGGLLFVLETFIRNKKLYWSGIDNAMLYSILGFLMASFYVFTSSFSPPFYVFSIIYFIFSLPFIYRYAEPFIAANSAISLFIFVSLTLFEFSIFKPLLPFVLIVISGGLFLFLQRIEATLYYKKAVLFTSVVSASVACLASNFYVVKESNEALLKTYFGGVSSVGFWVLSFTVPLAFLFFGLKKKDRVSFLVGLVGLAASLVAVRIYFDFFPTEWALIIIGLLLGVFAVFFLKFLQKTKCGITSVASRKEVLQNIEGIVFSQAFHANGGSNSIEFGGADFGGGGASGDV
jgi:uncharacterized membrane protein YgcG